ncbi:hypothetical protein SARC_10780 [Sphaeroforma arctica JP610]|uniref:Uncharacterized protein n=1 Tax=Sphaeroforma arctica JP610 TaxID=667725 RepID=A0A0L0FL45_9EUKA|nr:hypothetical protein SARC_10780 [Sphaeroforma arctica JP610]KNC76733.1 hypothetical protein SARC_10780 [Sphaeroforma arctica JP610]|eukprot:XP_014150635.1 hypothetical protein SARC_10780 [Sphaeroforma arctica JP610]
MLQKFRELTRKRRCEETLDALIGCRAIGYLFEIGSIAAAGQLTEQWAITHITGRDLCQHVNIGYESREALLQTIEFLHASVPISATTMQTFMFINQNLSFMLRTHVIALFKSEEVVEYCLKLLALAKVGFLNVDGSGVKPPTHDASTDIEVVSTAHS